MRIPLRAVVLVVMRLERKLARPALFDEKMLPHVLRLRRMRIEGWLGLQIYLVHDYIRRAAVPPAEAASLQRWTESGKDGGRPLVGMMRRLPQVGAL